MYHPPSKQKQIAMRFFIYGLMTVGVLTLATALLLFMLGFRFDTKDGKVEQVGFVQYISTPDQATVEVDGKALGPKTSTKSSVQPGSHEFVMWRQGYETWRKTLSINAGTLTWLNYARLVPKTLTVAAVKTLPTMSATLAAPQGRFMIAQTTPASPEFVLFDLRNDDAVTQTILHLPATVYTDAAKEGVTHSFQMIEWDQSGRYILVKHTYADKFEWLVLDRQDETQAKNITTALNVTIDNAHLSGTSGTVVVVQSAGDVRKLDLTNGTISRPLVSNVAEFQLYGTNVIAYTSVYDAAKNQRTVGIVRDSDKEPHAIRTVTGQPVAPLHIATSHYFNQDYVAIADGKKVDIVRGSYPSTADDTTSLVPYATFTFSRDVQWLDMSGNSRFVVAQTGDAFMSYDLERQTLAPEATLAGTGDSRKLRWLDDYYVWSDRSDTLVMREFDGANEHTINAVTTGFDATFSQNGKYLYSILKSANGSYQLQRVRMILP
jgi:hypothetical protein